MSATNLRAVLAADPELGAGNVLLRLAEHGADMDMPRVTFDAEVDAIPAWTPLSLRTLTRAGSRPGRMVCPARHRAARPGRGLRDLRGRRVPQLPRADLARGDTRADERGHAGRRSPSSSSGGCAPSGCSPTPTTPGWPTRDLGAPVLGDAAETGTGDPAARARALPAPPRRSGGHHALVRDHAHAGRGRALPPQPVRGRAGGPADRAPPARPGA